MLNLPEQVHICPILKFQLFAMKNKKSFNGSHETIGIEINQERDLNEACGRISVNQKGPISFFPGVQISQFCTEEWRTMFKRNQTNHNN